MLLLRYLLDKGANPNIYCRKGYNCLHVAVQQDKFIKAPDLFPDYNADVNVPDSDGANIVYLAIQGFLLRNTAEAGEIGDLRQGNDRSDPVVDRSPYEVFEALLTGRSI